MKNKLAVIISVMFMTLLGGCSSNNNASDTISETTNSESTSTSITESESEVPSESESESEVPSESESESEDPSEEPSEEPSEVDIDTFNSPNNSAKEVDIEDLLDLGSLGATGGTVVKTDTLYRIKGYVQFPFNTTYGNFDIVDETGSILVWGCSYNSSSIRKSGSSYSFSNDKSFSRINLKAGDYVTLEGLYTVYAYSKSYYKAEFTGYIVDRISDPNATISGRDYVEEDPYTGNYYSSVKNKTGNELLKGLHNLMMDTHDNYVSYNSLTSHLKKSDRYGNSSNAKCFYSGKSTSSFSREHVWCQSLTGAKSSSGDDLYGESHGGSDIHHIRPVISNYNSNRSNAAFGEIYGPKDGLYSIPYADGSKSYLTSSIFEPTDEIKGDVARIVMYMYMHYSSSICNDSSTYSFVGTMNIHYIMGPNKTDSFKLLRYWNSIDPVSDEEIKRNEYAYDIQGNRNPFIDHPSFADEIWG